MDERRPCLVLKSVFCFSVTGNVLVRLSAREVTTPPAAHRHVSPPPYRAQSWPDSTVWRRARRASTVVETFPAPLPRGCAGLTTTESMRWTGARPGSGGPRVNAGAECSEVSDRRCLLGTERGVRIADPSLLAAKLFLVATRVVSVRNCSREVRLAWRRLDRQCQGCRTGGSIPSRGG